MDQKSGPPAWKQIRRRDQRSYKGKIASFSLWPAKTQKQYKWQLLCELCSRQFSECVCDWQLNLFCKRCNQKQELCKCDWRRSWHWKPGLFYSQQERQFKNFDCKFLCCKSCSFCFRVAVKERRNSQLLSPLSRNKACERCFLCRSIEFYL